MKIGETFNYEEEIIQKKTWNEFRNSGLFWLINSILHVFGWAIIINFDENGEITEIFPARVKFRGFSEEINEQNYKKITDYLKENIHDIHSDFNR